MTLLTSCFDVCSSKLIVCYCKGGFRSAIACSLLLKAGFNAQDIVLGFAAVSVYSPTVTSSGEVNPLIMYHMSPFKLCLLVGVSHNAEHG